MRISDWSSDVCSSDLQGFTLARADGKPLQYDRYSLFIGDDAFVSRDGALLDGDADGTAGGGYRASILFASPSAGTAELPDFTRGPGEHVDVPLEEDRKSTRLNSSH